MKIMDNSNNVINSLKCNALRPQTFQKFSGVTTWKPIRHQQLVVQLQTHCIEFL